MGGGGGELVHTEVHWRISIPPANVFVPVRLSAIGSCGIPLKPDNDSPHFHPEIFQEFVSFPFPGISLSPKARSK